MTSPPSHAPPARRRQPRFLDGRRGGRPAPPVLRVLRALGLPPDPTCGTCGGTAEYRTLSGKGRVFTNTENQHPYNPAVPVPYLIAIVELVEQGGLRFTTNVVNCSPTR